MYLDVALLILVVILIVIVLCCIPLLLQIWRVSKDLSQTVQTLNQSLPLILKNLEEITTNVNNSSAVVNKRLQTFAGASGSSGLLLNDLINNLQYIAPLALKLPIFRIVRNVMAVAKGLSVFVGVLLNKTKEEKME